MRWHVGTSGWAYAPWRGKFYPKEVREPGFLPYYASRFSAVEVNATFYRLPQPSVVAGWTGAVGPDFRWVVKGTQKISHIQRFKDDDGGALDALLAIHGQFGAAKGPLYFQAPPNLKADKERLLGFLDRIPRDVPTTVELRHPSWLDSGIESDLRERSIGLTATDDGVPLHLAKTAPFVHVRLRTTVYDDAALGEIHQRIRALDVDIAFVFFKHDDEATGPALADRFLGMVSGG